MALPLVFDEIVRMGRMYLLIRFDSPLNYMNQHSAH
jgi:hypothetical protein